MLKTEGKHTGEFLVSEASGTRSRDQVTLVVPAQTTLPAGFVLGQLSANGTYVEYDNAGSDGSEEAAGILYEERRNDTNEPIDVQATVINADAEVRAADLVWKDGLNEAAQAAGLSDLRGQGIKAR